MLFARGFFVSVVSSLAAQVAAASLSLDPSNSDQLQKATVQALKNLLSYYVPDSTGVFNQAETPWHESMMIWGMLFDHAKWTGDTQFLPTATEALVNSSWKTTHDFLGGNQVQLVETILGRWNDDILWASLAVVSGAEIYGPQQVMGSSKGDWLSLAVKTSSQAFEQYDDKCGGGIYWSRNRDSKGGTYKSLITQAEFISQSARNYLQTHNTTALDEAKQVLDSVTNSGVGNAQTGVLFDGFGVDNCKGYTQLLWSYNYGQLMGSLAWMHKATGDQKYLDMIVPYFDYSVNSFAGQNTSGVITEPCEIDKQCNRDQQGFKAIYIRNLAYVYRETTNSTMKSTIRSVINASVQKMVNSSCDLDWNCGGNWTTNTQPVKSVRGQHVSSALLVAAAGIYNQPEKGLLPQVAAGNSSDSNTQSSAALPKAKSSASFFKPQVLFWSSLTGLASCYILSFTTFS